MSNSLKEKSEKIRSFFDAFASHYLRDIHESSLGSRFLSNIELNFIKTSVQFSLANQPKILDVGCGPGRILNLLKELSEHSLLIGVDISRRMIIEAKKSSDYSELLIANVENGLPFKNESVDIIVCIRVLKYLSMWRNAIKEMSRVLKKDGLLIIEFTSLHSVAYLTKHDFTLVNYKDLVSELKDCGLDVIGGKSICRLPFFVYRMVDNLPELTIIVGIEKVLQKIFPITLLSKSVFLVCRKR
jgi:ubiquinone/menaquinone biosynthesis C-methylase UbiE